MSKKTILDTDEYVFFYGKTTCFSNFYSAKFVVDSQTYYCSEQYVMHAKAILFKDLEIAKKILLEKQPAKMKALGRKVKNFDKETWNKNREKIMFDANLAKFSQNDELKEKLLETDPKTLVEASPSDTIWGVGLSINNPKILDPKNWRGLNLLGKTLVKVRDHLSNDEN